MAKASEPWDEPNPRKKAGKPSKHLGAKGKTKAKAIAKAHGRSRPSLVDNINALKGRGASKQTSTAKASAKKTTTAAKKASAKKSPGRTAKKKTKTAKRTTKTPAKKRTPKTRTTRTVKWRAPAQATKDPHGGLTAAGRREFARTEGAHLRPGVTKSESQMTPDDMRRKGSWAVRFYGRKVLPPLIDEHGEPTRHALSAHAWGEPVPKDEAAARKIAEKGRKLLAQYKATKESDA